MIRLLGGFRYLSFSKIDAAKVFNAKQVLILEEHFEENQYPSKELKTKLAKDMTVTPVQVRTWFLNKRRREKTTISRSVFSDDEIQELTDFHKDNPYPTTHEYNELAARLNKENEQIVTWFKNRRAKIKRKLFKKDAEYVYDIDQDKTLVSTESQRKVHNILDSYFEENIYVNQDEDKMKEMEIKLGLSIRDISKKIAGKRTRLRRIVGADVFEKLVLEGNFREETFLNYNKGKN